MKIMFNKFYFYVNGMIKCYYLRIDLHINRKIFISSTFRKLIHVNFIQLFI